MCAGAEPASGAAKAASHRIPRLGQLSLAVLRDQVLAPALPQGCSFAEGVAGGLLMGELGQAAMQVG